MVMPVWDHNPFEWPEPPYVMWAIIVINFGIFFWMAGLPDDQVEAISQSAGLIPLALSHGGPPGVLSPPLTVPGELVATYYAQRAEAGLIVTEGTSPAPDGLGW